MIHVAPAATATATNAARVAIEVQAAIVTVTNAALAIIVAPAVIATATNEVPEATAHLDPVH